MNNFISNNEWAMQSGDPSELANFGVQTAQLGGGDKQGNVCSWATFLRWWRRHEANEEYRFPVYGLPDLW